MYPKRMKEDDDAPTGDEACLARPPIKQEPMLVVVQPLSDDKEPTSPTTIHPATWVSSSGKKPNAQHSANDKDEELVYHELKPVSDERDAALDFKEEDDVKVGNVGIDVTYDDAWGVDGLWVSMKCEEEVKVEDRGVTGVVRRRSVTIEGVDRGVADEPAPDRDVALASGGDKGSVNVDYENRGIVDRSLGDRGISVQNVFDRCLPVKDMCDRAEDMSGRGIFCDYGNGFPVSTAIIHDGCVVEVDVKDRGINESKMRDREPKDDPDGHMDIETVVMYDRGATVNVHDGGMDNAASCATCDRAPKDERVFDGGTGGTSVDNDRTADLGDVDAVRVHHHTRANTRKKGRAGIIRPPPRRSALPKSESLDSTKKPKRAITWLLESSDEGADDDSDEQMEDPGVKVPPKRVTRSMRQAAEQDNDARPLTRARARARQMPHAPLRTPAEFKENDLVIAKYGIHPYWPGVIKPDTLLKYLGEWRRVNDIEVFVRVFFFSEYSVAWVPINFVVPLTLENLEMYCLPHGDCEQLGSAIAEACDRLDLSEGKEEDEEEMPDLLKLGDLVLANYDGYPPWPGIVEAADVSYDPSKAGKVFVGSEVHIRFLPSVQKHENFVKVDQVRLFTPERELRTRIRKDNANWDLYHAAIREAYEKLGLDLDLNYDDRSIELLQVGTTGGV